MSCLINIVGIPLVIGLIGYAIFCFIRANREAQELRRAQVKATFDQRKREELTTENPWKVNLQDSKFFEDGT